MLPRLSLFLFMATVPSFVHAAPSKVHVDYSNDYPQHMITYRVNKCISGEVIVAQNRNNVGCLSLAKYWNGTTTYVRDEPADLSDKSRPGVAFSLNPLKARYFIVAIGKYRQDLAYVDLKSCDKAQNKNCKRNFFLAVKETAADLKCCKVKFLTIAAFPEPGPGIKQESNGQP